MIPVTVPPPVLFSVNWLVELEPNVTTFPAVPVIVQDATLVVVPAVNRTVCATVFVLASVLNVLLPVKVSVDVPVAPPIVRLLYVNPPPANVLAVVVVLERTIVEVPALSVRLVTVPKSQIAPVPANVHVPDPMVSVLVLVPLPTNNPAVTL